MISLSEYKRIKIISNPKYFKYYIYLFKNNCKPRLFEKSHEYIRMKNFVLKKIENLSLAFKLTF